jgi:hypothetical protein
VYDVGYRVQGVFLSGSRGLGFGGWGAPAARSRPRPALALASHPGPPEPGGRKGLFIDRQIRPPHANEDPSRSLSLKLSDTRVDDPQIRAHLGTTAHCCNVVVSVHHQPPLWKIGALPSSFISHNVLIKRFWKANPPPKSSTYCLLLLIERVR